MGVRIAFNSVVVMILTSTTYAIVQSAEVCTQLEAELDIH